MLIGNHRQNLLAESVYALAQLLALACSGSKHNMRHGFGVVLSADVVGISVLAVGFLGNLNLQLVYEIVDCVSLVLHLHRLGVPCLHLLGILLHVLGKILVNIVVLAR